MYSSGIVIPDSHVFATAIASPSEKSGVTVGVGVGASAGAQEVVAMANRINAERINFNLGVPSNSRRLHGESYRSASPTTLRRMQQPQVSP